MTSTSAASDLYSPYRLPADAAHRFERNGFVRLPDVLSKRTLGEYEPEITRQVIDLNTQHLPVEQRSTYAKAFLQIENLWRHSEKVRELVFSTRLAGIASELLQVESVRLYHDQALYKEVGGGATPWHADQVYWPLSTDRVCTVWIPLQQTPIEMGPLEFAVGSHRDQLGRGLPISDDSQERMSHSNYHVVRGPFELGEVSYHLGWTIHHAPPNETTTPRRVMTIIYMDADITVSRPANDYQRNDLERWLPGTPAGAIPQTALNPVLYRRG